MSEASEQEELMQDSETAEVFADSEERGIDDEYLQIQDLKKVFQDGDEEVIAVHDFNLNIGRGEFVVLVGPSGCGKTTTLRCVAGLEEPTSGDIRLDGQSLLGMRARQRDVAMVFQTYALYPHMTVRENMTYPLKVRGYSDEEKERRVTQIAKLLQISELLERKPRDLSGGQQQRVALGRAIVREPEIFLFDEPLSNLDQKLRVEMRTELNKLHETIGKTTLYVTHDQAEAMTLGDKIVVMNDGEIQQIDPPQEIYHHPTNQFVAQFIGEPKMNFFPGYLEKRDGETVVQTEAFSSPIPIPDELASRIDQEPDQVIYGLRPEHIALTSQSENGVITSDVVVVEAMGDDKHLTLESNTTEYKAIVDGEADVARNDEITVKLDLERGHLFDPETGNSLIY